MRSALVGAAVLAAVVLAGHQAVTPPVAGTPTVSPLPYCQEEDGSGSPGAPCWWPANDRDILITTYWPDSDLDPADASD